jgi:hypothetical protein
MTATVIHTCNRQRIATLMEAPQAMIAREGALFSVGSPNRSNYDGYAVPSDPQDLSGVRRKILYDIAPVGPDGIALPIDAVEIDHGRFIRRAGTHQQVFQIDKALFMRGKGSFLLTLDCKRLFDEHDQGRQYARVHDALVDARLAAPAAAGTDPRPGRAIAYRYTKYPDGGMQNPLYSWHVAIITDMACSDVHAWREVRYAYDERRGTHATRWVYDALALASAADRDGRVVVATATDLSTTLSLAEDAWMHGPSSPRDTPTLPTIPQLAWRAYAALHDTIPSTLPSSRPSSDAHASLPGIMAGLPWFFQHWSRDELVAIGGSIATKDFDRAIAIIDRWYAAIADGGLPAIYPSQGLRSADAPGWLGKRTRDLLAALADDGRIALVAPHLDRWREAAGTLFDAIPLDERTDLVMSGHNETWMDTSFEDDGRTGYRIEIQALFLALYDAYAHLSTLARVKVLPSRSAKAERVIHAVHERLVRDGTLLDGLSLDGTPDAAVRPNLFLAWYVAPRLFSDAQWRSFFRTALAELWLPWGGLSSIGTRDPRFRPAYTGEHVASYHRGDSWYFVNNIAAMALWRTGKEGSMDGASGNEDSALRDRAKAILRASMHDLLSLGVAGHASEISSARVQESAGCYAQAWSASTLLEASLLIPDIPLPTGIRFLSLDGVR